MDFNLLYDALALYNLPPAELARRRNIAPRAAEVVRLPTLGARRRTLLMVDFSRRSKSVPSAMATPSASREGSPRRRTPAIHLVASTGSLASLASLASPPGLSDSPGQGRRPPARAVSSAGSKPARSFPGRGMSALRFSAIDLGLWRAGAPIREERDSGRSSPKDLQASDVLPGPRASSECPPLTRSQPRPQPTRAAQVRPEGGARRPGPSSAGYASSPSHCARTRGVSAPPGGASSAASPRSPFHTLPRLHHSSVQ